MTVIAVACDILATRKLLGYMSTNAVWGCSKCVVKLPGRKDNPNDHYRNYDWHILRVKLADVRPGLVGYLYIAHLFQSYQAKVVA